MKACARRVVLSAPVVIRPSVLLIIVSLLSACATTAPERKLSAAEAFGGASFVTRKKQRGAKNAIPPHNTAHMSDELNVALARFATAARLERSRVPVGAPMPSGAVKNWLYLNSAVDEFLRRPANRTSSYDVVRARITAEAELELDARAYGDIPVDLAENVLERMSRLAMRMAEVRRLHVITQRQKAMFIWPVEPTVVTSLFGRRLHPVEGTWKQHFGIDLLADEGQLISAAADGVVLRSGENGAHGIQVEVQHKGGLVTRYSHLSQTLVERGLVLKRGDPIGLAGSTGVSTGAHLHFEVWRNGTAVDPIEELGRPMPEADSVAAL